MLAMPEIRDRIVGPGNEIGGGTAEAFGEFILRESDRWQKLVRAAGIRVE